MVKCRWRQQYQYRANLVFRLAGDFLRTYIKVCIWTVLASETAGEDGNIRDMTAYSLIGTILMILTDTHIAQELAERFRSGEISVDLIRPVSLKWYQFFSQLGDNLFCFLAEGIWLILIYRLVWKVAFPPAGTLAVFGISTMLGIVLIFSIQYFLGLLVFWMKDGTYTRMISDALFILFSGLDIPLWFYPEWLRQVCVFLPFRYVVFEPAAVFLQKYSLRQELAVLAGQVFWIGAVTFAERRLWRTIRGSIEIQGG